MTQCGTCVSRLYKSVIDEVISGVKENFLDEGIDDQVLADLKQQWEAKLAATKAAEHTEITQQHQQNQQQHTAANQQQTSQQTQQTTTVQAMALVPIQITIPSQQAGGVAKTITIHAPSSALASGIAGPQLQNILSSPAAAQTFALETSQAAEIIQRELNTALQTNGVVLPAQLLQYNNPVTTQVDGPVDVPLQGDTLEKSLPGSSCAGSSSQSSQAPEFGVTVKATTATLDNILNDGLASQHSSRKGVRGCATSLLTSQTDGAYGLGDSSDEITDDDDDDDDEDDDKDDDDRKGKKDDDDDDDDAEDEAWNDEPLNSDDDVSDDEATDVFETENVVVCQYDKITRVRNKWKFHLKDGIMNLKSKDYVFTKASGEGEW